MSPPFLSGDRFENSIGIDVLATAALVDRACLHGRYPRAPLCSSDAEVRTTRDDAVATSQRVFRARRMEEMERVVLLWRAVYLDWADELWRHQRHQRKPDPHE